MTLVARAEILMDADQAKAELQATGTAAKGAARDIRALGNEASGIGQGFNVLARTTKSAQESMNVLVQEQDRLRAQFDPLFAASKRYETALEQLNAAQRVGALTSRQYDAALDSLNADFARYTGATRQLAGANRLAAGSMGNLVSQGNDVLVMLAAGQNPFQLAIQQGTQITQVIGPLGAAGAFRALGGAVLSMLSPINLITIGALAATAAVVNWFNRGGEEAQSFDDRLAAINDALSDYNEFANIAAAETADLIEKFGAASELGQDLADFIAARKNAEAINEIEGALDELTARFGGLSREALSFGVDGGGFLSNLFGNNSGGVMREIDATMSRIRSEFDLTVEEAARITLALENIDGADGIENTAAAALELKNALVDIFGSLGAIPGELGSLADAAARLALQAAEQATRETRRSNQEMLTFLDLVTKATGEQLKAEVAAQALLSTMTEQNAVAEAITRHGADSVEVTRLRAQFALDAKLEEIEASKASEDTKNALREAAQAAFDLSTADISGALNAAANEASRLAAEVRGAVDAMGDLQSQGEIGLENARIRAEFRDDPIGRAGALAGARFDRASAPIRDAGFENAGEEAFLNNQRQAAIELARETARLNELARPARSNSGGTRGGSTNANLREQQALDRLIESKRREIEALRESDPVQREMIRLRERLTAATPKQRAEIEALVEAHENERVAMERKEEFRDAVGDVLLEAESLRDVWSGIGDMIIRAAKEALILGSGPLGGLFGGSGILGGLVSGIGGGLGDLFGLFSGGSLLSFADGGLPGFASGGDPRVTRPGLLLGTGTGRGDKIPAFVSAGEFIMTAEATARNRAVLEAMNAGAIIPGFAGGGLPLPAQGAGAAQASGRAGASGDGITRLRIEPSELFRVVAEERARTVAVEVVDGFANEELPGRVEAIRRDPLRRG